MEIKRVFDYAAKDRATLESAKNAIKSIFPVKGATKTLRLKQLVIGKAPRADDFAAMKRTFYQGKTWGTPIHASLELIDNATGKVIDAVPKMKLIDVPRITPFYGYLVDGKHRYLQNQIRLGSGVYAGVTGKGLYRAQLMTAAGHNQKIHLEPRSGLITITPSGSSSEIKLLPVLRELGVSAEDLKRDWGQDVYDTNVQATGKAADTEILKFHGALFSKNKGYSVPTREKAVEDIHSYFKEKTAIGTGITARLLGKSYDRVSPALLQASASKLLAMSRGEVPSDDQNSMANKGLFSVDDFLRERLNGSKDKIQAAVHRQMEKRDTIREIVSSSAFTKPVRAFFNASEMATPIKQTNPLQMIGETFKTTLMGEGGIGDLRAVKEEARLVHGSHAGILDPVHTPEGEHIGVTLSVALGAQVMPDNSLAQTVINARTGKMETISARDLEGYTVAFPGEFAKKNGTWKPTKPSVRVLQKFKDTVSPAKQVDYIIPDARGMFTVSSNMIPFLNSVSGPRAMVGSKQVEQALPLVNPEAPLVQCGLGTEADVSFERVIGSNWTATADTPGIVTKTSKDSITVKGPHGEKSYGIFDHFPLNELSYMHSKPLVKVGDKVTPGQALADNTFTDKGTLAMGKNLHVAYLSHKSGKSYEDGIVISESAAKKMASNHLYRVVVKGGDNVSFSHDRFKARFPGVYNPEQLAKLDEQGLPKPGQKVLKGDPVGLRLVQEALNPEDKILQRLRRGFIQPLKNRTVQWDEDYTGEVVEVHKQGDDHIVVIKTEEPAREGDKLSGRFGNKGIVTAVYPDDKMPRTKGGQVIDMLLNPQGVLARMNTGQTLENLSAKVAKKAGNRPVHVHNFEPGSSKKKVQSLAKQYGVRDKEDLIDPDTGQTIKDVAVGYNYTYKLDHPVKKKFSAHSLGPYDSEGIPLRGHDYGAQSLDLLTIYSLLTHGSNAFLQESALKGNVNHEWWRAYRMGQVPPLPRNRQAYTRFKDLLRGVGVSVETKGRDEVLSPVLDRHVAEFSNGEIQKPRQVWAKNLAPEKYGLFDPDITGGLQGQKWGHIELAEPVPHPTFEVPIRILTGLTQDTIDKLVEHRVFLNPETLLPQDYGPGLTGGEAIKEKLKRIDVKKRLQQLRRGIPKMSGVALDKANKELRYLQALDATGISPEEYVVTKVPVLPPTLRPVYPDENGALRHSDLNFLYRDLMLINDGLRALQGLPDKEKIRQRQDLLDAFRALVGISTAPALIAGERRKGILHNIAGIPQPKSGYFQSKLLSRRQDIAGRSTIISAPELELDQAGIPEEMAWTLYRERGIRELIQRGHSPFDAEDTWDNQTPFAKSVLLGVMDKTPVILNRAPTLHKHGVQAFWGRLRKGKAIGVHPLVCKGFNADYDGDAMSVYVPVMPEAIQEAIQMMPSRNLWNPRDGRLMFIPDQEVVQGLYLSSKLSSAGREAIEKVLPEDFRKKGGRIWDRSELNKTLEELSRLHPKDFARIVNALKDLGNQGAYFHGATLGLSDLDIDMSPIQEIWDDAEEKAKKIRENKALGDKEKDAALVAVFKAADIKIEGLLKKLAPEGSQLGIALRCGAKAKPDQIKQTVASATLYESGKGGSVPVLVPSNFTDGMSAGDYWASLYGARKGMIDKGLSTAKPGELGKLTAASLLRFVVTEQDCHTTQGTVVNMEDKNEANSIIGRVLVEDAAGIKAGTVLTRGHLQALQKEGVSQVSVRTPLICESSQGVCQQCYGHKADTQAFPYIGANVGVTAAQSTSEPGVQLTMKAFHTAGSSASKESAGLTSQFDRINRLMTVPKTLSQATTIAEEDGEVTSIEPAPAGGTRIIVGDKKYFVSPGLETSLRVGDKVKKGQPLSEGEVNPHDLLEVMGPEATKEYISRTLRQLYQDGGTPLDRAHADLVARAMLDVADVEDPGDHPEVIKGDTVPLPVLTGFRPFDHPVETPVERCAGRTLAREYATDLKKGLFLTEADVGKLKGMGLKNVLVYAMPPKFKVKLTGVGQSPLVGTTSWISRLGSRELKKTITEGVAQGWSSSPDDTNPITALVVGAPLGKRDWSYEHKKK